MPHRLGVPVPTFSAIDKATGAVIRVDARTFDPAVHSAVDPAPSDDLPDAPKGKSKKAES